MGIYLITFVISKCKQTFFILNKTGLRPVSRIAEDLLMKKERRREKRKRERKIKLSFLVGRLAGGWMGGWMGTKTG